MAIAWDYADMSVTPSICASMLFIMSDKMGVLFNWMLVWVVFRYLWHRFIVLRTARKQGHSGSILEYYAEVFWGIPLSLVATASVWWWILSKTFAKDELKGPVCLAAFI